jgi:enoyl-CoA hydratase/carnithine racemase
MAAVTIEAHGPVAVLRLTNGVTNAIGSTVLRDIELLLPEVCEAFRGLVLAGNPKFFSIGLDLPELLALDRDGMADFWRRFEDLVLALYTNPLPTACAIAGHAPAAGTILAIACDFRFLATGKKLIGLNEITIGLPVPFLADLMLRQAVGDRAATEIEYSGDLIVPEKAEAIALVDALYPEGDVEPKAIAKISALIERPPFGFSLTKQHRTRDIRSRFLSGRANINTAFLECWFSSPVQEILKEASKKF